MARKLTEQQQAVVDHDQGNALVVAVAGSGKTTTIVHRIAHLLKAGTPASSILLVTFTNKAAAEMLQRAIAISGSSASGLKSGTFHSICAQWLRMYGTGVVDTNFHIADTDDSESLMRIAINTSIPASSPAHEEYLHSVKAISACYSYMRNRKISFQEALDARFPDLHVDSRFVDQIFEAYESAKQSRNYLDFDDLLVATVRLFDANPSVLNKLAHQLDYLIVDEYQDTNPLQEQLLIRLNQKNNLMVVGDPYQSIYGFRGSEVGFIMAFPERYSNVTTFMLEANYRSTQPILDAAQYALDKAGNHFRAKLHAGLSFDRVALPEVWAVPDVFAEARILAQMCTKQPEAHRNKICFLIRAGYQSAFLEKELARNRVKYVKYGGLRFADQAHVRDFFAFLRILLNPRDDLAWLRVFPKLPRIGPAAAHKLIAKLEAGAPMGKTLNTWKSCSENKFFLEWLGSLEDVRNAPVTEMAERIIKGMEELIPLVYDKEESSWRARLRDLPVLLDASREYEDPVKFIQDYTLDAKASTMSSEDQAKHVVVSTLHSAKGLEWDAVYILQCLAGAYPSYRAETVAELEEEHRLFYVALTRAKTTLALLVPEKDSRMKSTPPSDYVLDLRDLGLINDRDLRG